MFITFGISSFVILIVYSILIFVYFIFWKRLRPFIAGLNKTEIFASIIIPARNEELNIGDLLNDLHLQDYLKSNFEIIIVNDHSNDNTLTIAISFKTYLGNIQIIDLPEDKFGKKAAILAAITKAKGELIITLDADCRVGKSWLSAICEFYEKYKPKLIIGPLIYSEEKTLFEKMQSLEILSLVASSAGAAALGRPIMCNGANLAFTRESYFQSSSRLKTETASGDDIFLMLEIKKQWPNSIRFIKSKEAACFTRAELNLSKYLMQRKRWTSKSKFYNDSDIILVAGIVFFTNFCISLSFFIAFFKTQSFSLFFVLLCLKSIPDFILLHSFANYFSKKKLLNYFVITQLIYPFYLVFMAIYGNLGKFEWKKRIYK